MRRCMMVLWLWHSLTTGDKPHGAHAATSFGSSCQSTERVAGLALASPWAASYTLIDLLVIEGFKQSQETCLDISSIFEARAFFHSAFRIPCSALQIRHTCSDPPAV